MTKYQMTFSGGRKMELWLITNIHHRDNIIDFGVSESAYMTKEDAIKWLKEKIPVIRDNVRSYMYHSLDGENDYELRPIQVERDKLKEILKDNGTK